MIGNRKTYIEQKEENAKNGLSPKSLSPEELKKFKHLFLEKYKGVENASKWPILR